MIRRLLVAVSLMIIPTFTGFAETYPELRCTGVIDGDTLEIEFETGITAVHLWGIDSPELAQEWGEEAQQFAEKQALNKIIAIESKGTINGHMVATVTIDGEDLASLLLKNGLAWLSDGGGTSDTYAMEIIMARAGKTGMWADQDLLHPAKWREAANRTPTPVPTATPRPPRVSDIAGDVDISDESGNTISSENAPSKESRRKETQKFTNRMQALSNDARRLRQDRGYLKEECGLDDVKAPPENAEPGSYWSEEDQKWVSDSNRWSASCDRIRTRYLETLEKIKIKKRNAVAEAQRFGVESSAITRILKYNGLSEF